MASKRAHRGISERAVLPGSLTGILHELARIPRDVVSDPQPLHAGAVVAGRFTISRELGRGGLGVVYEARDEELGRSVALKVVRPCGTLDGAIEERLAREAEAVARLSHPCIVTLHDFGRSEHGPYLVLELLRGQTLAERQRHGRLPLREVLRIVGEVAKGLAHAHAAGVVHRDLKPANVFLCVDGQVKLLDFGLAHALGRRMPGGGTPAFMAPEQRRGAPEDERTDVFALGVLLYELLAGELPFPEGDEGKALVSERPAPALEVPDVPALGVLVARMLAKDPVARPRDAAEVRDALAAFLRELDRISQPPREASPPRTAPRRRGGEATIPKLCAPRLGRVFPRTRLFRVLDAARDHPAVWIGGPPGAGKTTLVASWVARRRLRALWYDVDPGDDDVASFFHYLAVGACAGRGRDGLPVFAPEYRGGLGVFSRRFFRELARHVVPPFVLVLDNAQEVPPESRLFEAVRDGLEELPRGAMIAIASRAEPPPVLARSCAYGVMTVLTGEDLRLSAGEARGIVRARRSPLPPARAAELAARADGWTAGLVLLLESAGARNGAPDGVARAPQVLFDFFAGEIFDRASPKARKVLLATALLPRPTASAAERLTGLRAAPGQLEELVRRGYFTARAGPDAYRYHPLFRQFLLSRGREALGPEKLARLRLRAAQVLEEEGHVEDAQALHGEDGRWDEVARLALAHGPALVQAGRGDLLLRWVERVPPELLERAPELLLSLGQARLAACPGDARRWFERAFERSEGRGDAGGAYAAWAAAVDTFVWDWSTFAGLDPWIEALDRLRGSHPEVPSPEIAARVALAALAALAFHRPDHPALPAWEAQVFGIATTDGVPLPARVAAGTYLIVYDGWFMGDLARARRVVEAVGPLARAPGVDPATAIMWRSGEAPYHWNVGAAEDARRVTGEGLALAHETGIHGWDFMLHLQAVWSALAADDPEEGERALRRSWEAIDGGKALQAGACEAAAALLALRGRDWGRALRHARAGAERNHAGGYPFGEAICRVATARALGEAGAPDEARRELGIARRIGAGARSAFLAYLCALAEARVALASGDAPRAEEPLRAALGLGRERGLVNHLWFTRDETEGLCAAAIARGAEVEEARRLAAARARA